MTNGSDRSIARRLHAPFLAGNAPKYAERTVARMVGIKAQSTVSAGWSIGLRRARRHYSPRADERKSCWNMEFEER